MNDAQPSLQRLTAADVDAVSALARVVWLATYPSLISQAQIDAMLAGRYAPQRIREQLDDPRQAWWVAKRGHTLAGFAHAMLDESGCKLDKLYVHPDQQRHGIGIALEKTVEDWARRQRAGRVWLQVNRGNAQAIAAYRKYGFRIVESRVFDIGGGFVMDDHVMEHTL
ncbi:MAG: GNAT family N-acetyltransferase [Thiobacillus sp.]|nr:GNAT family N-acetyltransferase [Thiobacillus sp.]MDP2978625.1 GNAT family N-acetyltransferase [Thiobacillus sp.]